MALPLTKIETGAVVPCAGWVEVVEQVSATAQRVWGFGQNHLDTPNDSLVSLPSNQLDAWATLLIVAPAVLGGDDRLRLSVVYWRKPPYACEAGDFFGPDLAADESSLAAADVSRRVPEANHFEGRLGP